MMRGCAIAGGLLVLLLAAVFTLPRYWDTQLRYATGRSAFPAAMAIERVIDSRFEWGGRESCVGVAARLTPQAATAIESGGLDYLNTPALRRGGDGSRLEIWEELPPDMLGHDDFGPYRLSASGSQIHLFAWCDNRSDRSPPFPPGGERGYATSFNHGEGVLIVFPTSRLAYHTYQG